MYTRILLFVLVLLMAITLISPVVADDPVQVLGTKATKKTNHDINDPVTTHGIQPKIFVGGGPMIRNPKAPLPKISSTPVPMTINDIKMPSSPTLVPSPIPHVDPGAIKDVGKKIGTKIVTRTVVKVLEEAGKKIGGNTDKFIKELVKAAGNKLVSWTKVIIECEEFAKDPQEILYDKQKAVVRVKEQLQTLQNEYNERLSEAAKVATQSPDQKALLEALRHQINELRTKVYFAQKEVDEAKTKTKFELPPP